MSLKNDVLQELLNAEDYISGEALAAKFGKSRAAVWKAVRALRKGGCKITAATNRGYKIEEDADLLSAGEIKRRLKNNIKVKYYPVIDSTNNEAKRLTAQGESEILLVAAGEQSAGRGRNGKSFYSPAETGIYMSLVLHPNTTLQNAVASTTAASVAVCRAIERLTDISPQIKWVNDVYVNEKKICGILTEAVTDFESGTVSSIIIGIGVNISTIYFPEEAENAGSLGEGVKRASLIAAIADELLSVSLGDYSEFIDYYISRSMIIGREITYIRNGRAERATAVKIDERGGLVIENEKGERQTLSSGDISIRRI